MDQQMILEHLAQSREHIALGDRHLAQQRELIIKIECEGRDFVHARELLIQLERMQEAHVAHRDWLEKELAES